MNQKTILKINKELVLKRPSTHEQKYTFQLNGNYVCGRAPNCVSPNTFITALTLLRVVRALFERIIKEPSATLKYEARNYCGWEGIFWGVIVHGD